MLIPLASFAGPKGAQPPARGYEPPRQAQPPAILAVATTLPVWLFAKNVAGERAEVVLLIPPGTDIHEFSLRPLDLKRLMASDLVFFNGAGLDDHIKKRIPPEKAVDTSKGVNLIKIGAATDPHIWLDPAQAIIMTENIRDAFIKADPEGRPYYEEQAKGYTERLRALDMEMAEGLSAFKGLRLITYHEAFNYFARRYGLIPYSLTGPGAEQPLPRRIKKVYDMITASAGARSPAIFVERQFPKGDMEKLSKGLGGMKVCTLDSIETGRPQGATSPGDIAATSPHDRLGPLRYYETMMRENTAEIIRCLK